MKHEESIVPVATTGAGVIGHKCSKWRDFTYKERNMIT